MWGSIMGSASYAGCTIREGDRLCLQKEIGPNNWHSVVDCRGASYMKGVTGVDTFAHGCTNHPSYFGKYRAYAIIGGRAYSSSYRYCSS
ncbi:hypothetical protein NOCA180039 [metagenome]|uniref:Uncharacterized protein n=1 Tax=metagenome TaxID=256318 RepID=A0A2P2CK89_9ZZZZ